MLVPLAIGAVFALIGLVTVFQPHAVVQGATCLGVGFVIMLFTQVRTTTATKNGAVTVRERSVWGARPPTNSAPFGSS